MTCFAGCKLNCSGFPSPKTEPNDKPTSPLESEPLFPYHTYNDTFAETTIDPRSTLSRWGNHQQHQLLFHTLDANAHARLSAQLAHTDGGRKLQKLLPRCCAKKLCARSRDWPSRTVVVGCNFCFPSAFPQWGRTSVPCHQYQYTHFCNWQVEIFQVITTGWTCAEPYFTVQSTVPVGKMCVICGWII